VCSRCPKGDAPVLEGAETSSFLDGRRLLTVSSGSPPARSRPGEVIDPLGVELEDIHLKRPTLKTVHRAHGEAPRE